MIKLFGALPLKRFSLNIIGDSQVREVATYLKSDHIRKKCSNIDIASFTYPGQTAGQINNRVRCIPVSDVTAVMAGTCNIETDDAETCKENIRKLVDNVSRKRQGRTVIMCEIARRMDKPKLNEKITRVNSYLSDLVSKYDNVHLLCHENAPGDFSDDGLHFNKQGIAKFGLNIREVMRELKIIL